MSEITLPPLPLDQVVSKDTFCIYIQFINLKISFKIFENDCFADIIERALYVLDYDV